MPWPIGSDRREDDDFAPLRGRLSLSDSYVEKVWRVRDELGGAGVDAAVHRRDALFWRAPHGLLRCRSDRRDARVAETEAFRLVQLVARQVDLRFEVDDAAHLREEPGIESR